MSSKKGKGSSSNGRDSIGKRLGIKVFDGEVVTSGSILVRQRGTKIWAGEQVGMGRDHTLFATKDGKVKYAESAGRTYVKII